MDIYNKARDIIIDIVTKRYHELDIKTLNLITCEQPKNIKFGDLSTNLLMILRNKISEDVNEIKDLITVDLKAISIFERVTYVKPGFINFIMKKNIWYEIICYIKKSNNYGFKNIGSNRKVNLEFLAKCIASCTSPSEISIIELAILLSEIPKSTLGCGTKYFLLDSLNSFKFELKLSNPIFDKPKTPETYK